MNSENPAGEPRFGVRFTIRSLLIVTTVVAAFFGGRASMHPELEMERLRTKIAQQEAQASARQLQSLQQSTTSQSQYIQRFIRPRAADRQAIDRAEEQNLYELRQRIEKAINDSEL